MRNLVIATASCFLYAIIVPSGCAASPANGPKNLDAFVPVAIDPGSPYPQPPPCDQTRPVLNEASLPIPLLSQHTSYTQGSGNELCWAAALAMVSTGLGNPRDTCYVASYLNLDGANCCRMPIKDAAERCNRPLSTRAVPALLRSMGIRSSQVDGALSEDILRFEISQGRPAIVRIREGGWHLNEGRMITMEHVMVIAGYADSGYRVLDPDTYPEQTLTYAELLHGRNGRPWEWEGTWYLFSFRRDGCNPVVNDHCSCSSE